MLSIAQKLIRLADIFGGNGTDANGNPLSNRNYVVDGAMEYSGAYGVTTASLASGNYTQAVNAMYYMGMGAGGAGVASRGSITPGAEPLGMTPTRYNSYAYLQQTTSTTTANTSYMMQRIESVQTLQGRSSTFSFWARTPLGTVFNITQLFAYQNFGTGGSPSASISGAVAVNFQVTSSWQRFSARIDWPSVQNKTLGTNSNDFIQVGFWLPNGVIDIVTSQWQLEQSSPYAPAAGLPTAFEYRGVVAESQRVARYFQTLQSNWSGYAGAASQGVFGAWPLSPVMRATPAVSVGVVGNLSNLSAPLGSATASLFQSNATSVGAGVCSLTNYQYQLDARI